MGFCRLECLRGSAAVIVGCYCLINYGLFGITIRRTLNVMKLLIIYLLVTVNGIQGYSQMSFDKYAHKPQVYHTNKTKLREATTLSNRISMWTISANATS
jgi:hypothetical protein